MTIAGLRCQLCEEPVAVYATPAGEVVFDIEPTATGDYALVAGRRLRIVEDWHRAEIVDGRIHESDVKRQTYLRYSSHESTCSKRLHVDPDKRRTRRLRDILSRKERDR